VSHRFSNRLFHLPTSKNALSANKITKTDYLTIPRFTDSQNLFVWLFHDEPSGLRGLSTNVF
jgi:hypothetical protein